MSDKPYQLSTEHLTLVWNAALNAAADLMDKRNRGVLPERILSQDGNAIRELLDKPGKEVMPDGTSKVWNHDAASAGLTAGGGAGQMADTPVVTGLVASNMTAGGGAEKMALCDAIRMGMGLLRVTHVDPDQRREDRDERARLAREDDQ